MIRKNKVARLRIRRKKEANRRWEWESYQTLLILQHWRATNNQKFAEARMFCQARGMEFA